LLDLDDDDALVLFCFFCFWAVVLFSRGTCILQFKQDRNRLRRAYEARREQIYEALNANK
jgi:hypothetical protein